MRRRCLAPFALVALLGAVACAKGATTASPARLQAHDYHPLAVGNQWTYAGRMVGQPIERTITVTGERDGYFVDDAKGLLRADATGLRDDKRYLLMEPVERGTKWRSIVSVASTENYEIIDAGFTTTTPAGTFKDCVLVRASNRIDRDREMQNEWTFAPGVGIVRISTTVIAGGRVIPQGTLELKSYRVQR